MKATQRQKDLLYHISHLLTSIKCENNKEREHAISLMTPGIDLTGAVKAMEK